MGAYAENHTFHSAAVGNGNGTALTVTGYAGVGVQVEGITTATVTFQGTIDGSTYYAVEALNYNDGSKATNTTADGLFIVPTAGMDKMRCVISGYSAGTITISGRGVTNPAAVNLGDVLLDSSASVQDGGPSQTLTRTYTTSADMTTAADITPAPGSGEKIHALDILVSSDTQMLFSVQMETSANVLAAVRLPEDGTVQITLRGEIVADAANKKLQGKASAAGNVYITAVTYSGS